MNERMVSIVVLSAALNLAMQAPARAQTGAEPSTTDIAALKAEIDELKRLLPSQSHTMADVEFHFANLWFAGKEENWPLATFYLNETRSHLGWTVRLHPVRRISTGDLDLRPILENVEKSGLADLKKAIDAKDEKAFEASYRATLNQCYACHVASEKPFLRPEIPEAPESRLMIHEHD
ncbi:MAG TPA: hypothetical protein VFV10_00575 [Gammaproteobacteria bacterium]|nr:hypothetical protein [Gammaproteobacteria bacterium]